MVCAAFIFYSLHLYIPLRSSISVFGNPTVGLAKPLLYSHRQESFE